MSQFKIKLVQIRMIKNLRIQKMQLYSVGHTRSDDFSQSFSGQEVPDNMKPAHNQTFKEHLERVPQSKAWKFLPFFFFVNVDYFCVYFGVQVSVRNFPLLYSCTVILIML